MQPFTLGHASGQSASQILDDCLAQLGDLPADANIGFVYATDALAGDLPQLVKRLQMHTGIDCWHGAVGIGINATGREYYARGDARGHRPIAVPRAANAGG